MARFVALLVVLALGPRAPAGPWPQFRGPGGLATPDVDRPVPDEIGPTKNVLWKVSLPPGHSSPVVAGNRIYLTAVRDKKLLTLALDRASGKTLWEAEAPYKKLEKIHAIGSFAQDAGGRRRAGRQLLRVVGAGLLQRRGQTPLAPAARPVQERPRRGQLAAAG